MQGHTATYSPDDNKLRLYAASRLPREDYDRVKAAGFKWAPRQKLFVAPMWTPAREDLLIKWCGDIGDEDTSLVDRAEERAERFEEYSDKRLAEGKAAHAAVEAICEHIPLGQPILVGHHSEKRARKDAERIESGMRKTIRLFEASTYWEARAVGALRHAKYKEDAGVRQRRIKGLESDLRNAEKASTEAQRSIAAWSTPGISMERALENANHSHVSRCFPLADFPRDPPASQYEGDMGLWTALNGGVINAEQAAKIAVRAHSAGNDHRARWITHYQNRLTYERAMLAEAGGGAADRFNIEVGGQVLVGREWVLVLRVNKAAGRISSVRTNRRYVPVCDISEVLEYRAPTSEQAATVAAAMTKAPLCNYAGENFLHMTQGQWDKINKDYKWTKTRVATEAVGAHRVREISGLGFYGCDHAERYSRPFVFITDAKVTQPPAINAQPSPAPLPRPVPVLSAPRAPTIPSEAEEAARAMRAGLKGGIQVAVAPQLFPTPSELAAKVARMADVQPGMAFLEPSAGTGNLVDAVLAMTPDARPVMIESDSRLADHLADKYRPYSGRDAVICADFLSSFYGSEFASSRFERIVMNPPFANGADIKHITAAARLLSPGGRLVAICGNGPRQREALKPLATHWEDLPTGSFEASGTMVNAALLVIENPAVAAPVEALQLGMPLCSQADLSRHKK